MPLQYSTYISYPHGNGIIRDFVEQLRHHLTRRIESYIRYEPFYDKDRLGPGYKFNEALARSLCKSISMIVVYVPEYESRAYCLREFAAMEALEQQRLDAIKAHLNTAQGMIFPIVLRQLDDGPPAWMTSSNQYSDFSQFQMGYGDIFETPAVILEIEKIGKAIRNLYDAFGKSSDPCLACDAFTLPTEAEIAARLKQPLWSATFPGRGAKP